MYIGNLVGGLVTEEALRQLFNNTMAAAFPDQVRRMQPRSCFEYDTRPALLRTCMTSTGMHAVGVLCCSSQICTELMPYG